MEKESGYKTITPGQLSQWLDERRDFLLLDVLPNEVFKARCIPGARNACVYEVTFPDQVAAISTERERLIVVYGSSHLSLDAATAAEKLVRLGYRSVYTLAGGVLAWRKEGLPLEGEEPETVSDPGTRLRLLDGTYKVDPEASLVAWIGRNANKAHHGTVQLAGGELSVRGGSLSGAVEVDMRSIKNIDLGGDELQPVLIAHLESDDFFFVKSFSSAKFTIKTGKPLADPYLSSPNYEVEGAFELRGVSQDIHFLATVSNLEDGRIAAEAHFDIDRTRWKVLYGSSRFFEHLGMHLVFDPLTIQLRIVAS
jgi:rhodanese-related sulfurtransferase